MFRQMLMSGAARLYALEDDHGSEFEDPDADLGEEQEELDDQGDEDEVETDEQEEDQDDEVQEEAPRRQPSRGENRVAAAARVAAEAKAEATALRQEIERMRSQQQQQPQETQAQRNARLADMEPWERSEYLRQESEARQEARWQRMEFNAAEAADKTAYEGLKLRLPAAGKYEKDVEERLAQMRSSGTTASRETVLKWVIGDRAVANATRATGKAQRSADTRRQQQTAKPSGGRSDSVEASRGGKVTSAADYERRYGDKPI